MSGIAEKNPSLLDDNDIIALSADVAEPLLPVLEQSRGLRPLIVVLAVLPGFIALERHGMDDFSSVWALRALSCFQSGSLVDFIDPGESGRTAVLSSQPPLATWLTAAIMAIFGPTIMHVPLIVPLLATAGCVWWTFRLIREVAGPRKGFWAAVLVSTNGSLLLVATNTAPAALTLFLVLVVFDAWLRHFRQRRGDISIWLLIAGSALGLCLLSGGPVAFAVLAVLLLKPALERAFPVPQPAHGKFARPGRKPPRLSVALGVAILTAFAVGGWWLMRATAADAEVWFEWFQGYEAPTLAAVGGVPARAYDFPPVVSRAVRLCVVIGPILPLCIFGVFLLLMGRTAPVDRSATFAGGRDSAKSGATAGGFAGVADFLADCRGRLSSGRTGLGGRPWNGPHAAGCLSAGSQRRPGCLRGGRNSATSNERLGSVSVDGCHVRGAAGASQLGTGHFSLDRADSGGRHGIAGVSLLIGWRLRRWVGDQEVRKQIASGR